jgi:hypothetical protein
MWRKGDENAQTEDQERRQETLQAHGDGKVKHGVPASATA